MSKVIDILKKKSLPLDKFINIALYNKEIGYYMNRNPFGKKGDYITSPLISNLFGEMIAVWCVSYWEHLGRPKKIKVVELGPGDASLSKTLLNSFKNFKDLNKCIELILLEKSTFLKKLQRIKLKNEKVRWVKNLNQIKTGPIIFLGNEFFDALPIKQIHNERNLYMEKYVAFSKKNKKVEFVYKKLEKKLIQKIKKLKLINKGNFIEYPIKSIEYLEMIAKKIKRHGGGMLTFDYGYTKYKNRNTLQSVKKHKYTNILFNPSNADITSEINFTLFSKVLKKNGLNVKKVVTQNEFLQRLGIIERANILAKNKNFKDKADLYYRLRRLLDYKEMGHLFKVLFAQKKNTKFSLGFL